MSLISRASILAMLFAGLYLVARFSATQTAVILILVVLLFAVLREDSFTRHEIIFGLGWMALRNSLSAAGAIPSDDEHAYNDFLTRVRSYSPLAASCLGKGIRLTYLAEDLIYFHGFDQFTSGLDLRVSLLPSNDPQWLELTLTARIRYDVPVYELSIAKVPYGAQTYDDSRDRFTLYAMPATGYALHLSGFAAKRWSRRFRKRAATQLLAFGWTVDGPSLSHAGGIVTRRNL